jgi:predicted choloylglycine hydrolase
MPEMLELYDELAELAGGGDEAARFLSVYCPPPYLAGCSQAVWPGNEPLLVRNYDYNPRAFDAVMLRTNWMGRRVVGMSDSLIGLLDGMNDQGLAVSLTFGGRRVVGTGFGIPIVLRYILQTCSTVDEAAAVLQRIPCHMAYNVTLLEKSGRHKTVFMSPDRAAAITDAAVATNHQHEVEWSDHARATASVEREDYLLERLMRHPESEQKFIAAFQRPPLYSLSFDRGFGTLYTAAYRPTAASVDLRWPGLSWTLFLDAFVEGARHIEYRMPASQPVGAL